MNWCQYLKINSKDEGVISFTPDTWYDAQWMVVEALFCNPMIFWFIILKGRQQGVTTVICAFDLYMAFKRENLQGAIVSADYLIAEGIRATIREMYQNLPVQAKFPKKYDNANMLTFENRSRLRFFFTTSKTSKKGNMGRSGSNNYGHFTEVAFLANVDDFDSFIATLSEEYGHRKYIFESTANGYNHWHEMWENAKESNTQMALFLGWWAKETYRLENDDKDLEKYGYEPVGWEKDNIALVKKLYHVELSMNQIAWWRKKMKEEMSDRGTMTREDIMLQEFPYTEYDSFRLSGRSFFKAKVIEGLQNGLPKPIRCSEPIFRTKPENTTFVDSPAGKIKIWEEPEEGATYILGGDPSYGANPDSDNAVIAIYKAFKDRIIQVVEYADNIVDTFHYTWLLISLAGIYGAPQIIEVNGPGKVVLQLINNYKMWIKEHELEAKQTTVYDYAKRLKNEYVYRRVDSLSVGGSRQWLTTPATKEHLMFQFQSAVHNEEVLIRSMKLLKEMEYVVKKASSIEATEGKNDDRVIASALCCEFWMQSFRNRLPTELEYNENKEKQINDAKWQKDNPRLAFSQYMLQKMVANS